ncbi:MAG: heavy metal translocating P-type ATPase [Bryobacterales bacterium]|nr:heavy metal translocating P-type ATPase [Bryobacterales bacterium]
MPTETAVLCDHCGLECPADPYRDNGQTFCCQGCLHVAAILRYAGPVPEPKPTAVREREAALAVPAEERLFHIGGLWCTACSWLIEHTLREHRGIVSAEVFFTSDLLKVRYLPQEFNIHRIPELLSPLGYTVAEFEEGGAQSDDERKDLLLRTGVAVFFWLNVMGFNLAAYLGAFDSMQASARQMLPVLALVLSLPVLFYSARPIYRLAWAGVRSRTLRMETLLALGITTAFGYSTFEGLRGGSHIYFDIACAITALVLVGKSIEQGAKQRAAATITALHRMLPQKARLENGRFATVDQLEPGKLFLVKAGERIPADGIVHKGESQADESLLTGESVPVTKRPGDAVVAGSLNLGGVLTVAVTATGRESTIAQIVGAVEQALASRSDLARNVDRAARWFVPVVIGIAMAVALATGDLLRGITILVIACPCALGLATPLALTAAVSAASRLGVLVRDARVLESVRTIDAVILDKTGTVTEANFALLDYNLDHLAALAAVEAKSEHPLGQAVVDEARRVGLALPACDEVVVHKAAGITGKVNEQAWAIGNPRLITGIPGELLEYAQTAEGRGHTTAFYSCDGIVMGVMVFGSHLRPEAKLLVQGLQSRGVRVLLVSGDSARTTRTVAESLGIVEYYPATTPEEKALIARDLKAKGHRVAVIGDGVNDAPALAHADLGIAMGCGADLAMRAASLTLLHTNLTRVLDAIDLSKRTHAVVMQNLFWAFFYNSLGIGFAAAGLLNPIVAAAAMVLSSLSVIGNSYRLAKG